MIIMEHGSGGAATDKLIAEIFSPEFYGKKKRIFEDATLAAGDKTLAVTTDSFVVDPPKYPGGDIGRLCVCGTVNDLLMRGAIPKYITCGFILQERLSKELLKTIVHSLAETAKEAGVEILAGDTKVIEGNSREGGIFINTTGIGFVPDGRNISAANLRPGDAVIVSGTLGEHHAAIMNQRLSITNAINSDNAPLRQMVDAMFDAGIEIHAMRDVTRGGLATVLKELAIASKVRIEIEQNKIQVSPDVRGFCDLLGMDPLYMGNEGKLVAIVPKNQAEQAVDTIRNSKYGENAAIIGSVMRLKPEQNHLVLRTAIGGTRVLDVLQGEGLPRIC